MRQLTAILVVLAPLAAATQLSTVPHVPLRAQAGKAAEPDEKPAGTIRVEGTGVSVIEVEQIVTQKVKRTAVLSFPCTLSGEKGWEDYFWTVPQGVSARDLNDRLQITAAPRGEILIGLKMVKPRLDKDGKYLG